MYISTFPYTTPSATVKTASHFNPYYGNRHSTQSSGALVRENLECRKLVQEQDLPDEQGFSALFEVDFAPHAWSRLMVFSVEISLRGLYLSKSYMIWSNSLNVAYIGYICMLPKHVYEAAFDTWPKVAYILFHGVTVFFVFFKKT